MPNVVFIIVSLELFEHAAVKQPSNVVLTVLYIHKKREHDDINKINATNVMLFLVINCYMCIGDWVISLSPTFLF